MKTLLISLSAKYIHKAPAPWMLREACAREGITIDIYEGDINRPYTALLRDILRIAPRIAAFSCSIWNIALIERLTRALRRACPSTLILWGGPEVSYDASRRLQAPWAERPDIILRGEGEQTLPRVLTLLNRGELPRIPGIATPDFDGGLAQPVPPHLWPFPYPAGAKAEAQRLHYVETSRGCPYSCGFCLSSLEKGVRALPAEQALERLLLTRDAGARTVKILDRTFNFDSARARKIWQGLIERGAGAAYHFEIVAQTLEPQDLELLSTAPPGLFQMEIGVQTTGSDTLSRVSRRQDFERLAHNVRALRRCGNIHLHLDLIAGLPGDRYETFAKSIDDVLSLQPHALQLGFLKLLPGTALRAEFDAHGWPYDPAPPYEVIASDAMSAAELDLLHDIEEVLSHFAGSSLAPTTAQRYLASFAQMEMMAKHLRAEGFFDQPRSQEARFDALWRFLPKEPLCEMLLRHDYLSLGKRTLRSWMRDMPQPQALSGLPVAKMRRSAAQYYEQDFLRGTQQPLILLYTPDGVHRADSTNNR